MSGEQKHPRGPPPKGERPPGPPPDGAPRTCRQFRSGSERPGQLWAPPP